GSNALVRALASGADTVDPLPGAASVADSLVVEVPRAARLALRRIRESDGAGVCVDDEAIVAAIGRLAAATGVFGEPAAAASLAGLDEALERKLVDRDERVVLLVTGSGLKDISSSAQSIAIPEAVEAHLDAVMGYLRTADWMSETARSAPGQPPAGAGTRGLCVPW
ncbi:MAG: hypothetical protein C3F15_08160, partial [Holophagae bacterium]